MAGWVCIRYEDGAICGGGRGDAAETEGKVMRGLGCGDVVMVGLWLDKYA